MDLIKNNEQLENLQFNNLRLIQNPLLYCFTSDAVDLSDFVVATCRDKIVDLGSGSGVIGILIQAKTGAKIVKLVEIQKELAQMSERTIKCNNLENIDVINLPIQNVHQVIGSNFDVAVCNPPYKKNKGGKVSTKPEIAMCKHEVTITLEEIIVEASKLLKHGGKFYTVNKEERLADIFCLMRKYNIEPKTLKIKKSVKGANIVLVEGRKGGKSGLVIRI